ncbi:isochorismate synthase [Listeria aquatica]|uniref:isochorismate synthase n=1 Tax=Listeria aquatica TaxID=1494960 RepID=UPI003EF89C8D
MGITLPLALFEQAKRHATKDEPALLSFVHEFTSDVSPLVLYQKAKDAFSGERFFWQNPEKTLTLAGFGVTEQFLAQDKQKDGYKGLEDRIRALKVRTVTNATDKQTGPLYFGGFAFDPERETGKEWQVFKDALFYLPLFMVTKKQEKVFLTVNVVIYPDDETNKFEAVQAQWEKIANAAIPNLEVDTLVSAKELEPDAFLENAAEIVSLLQGSEDLHKVVLSRRMGLRFNHQVDGGAILEQMIKTQSSSYFFVLEKGSALFFGATPERLVSVSDGEVYSSCVAGSAARGKTEAEDEKLGNELLTDAKNLREHRYVVDMIENTLREFTDDLSVSSEPVLLKNRDIQHLYMNVKAKKRSDVTITEIARALHPTPALGGVPQQMAKAIIRMKETDDRGLYGAPIGFVDMDFEGEFAVAIRSGLVVDSLGILFAGCGIVSDSVPKQELEETRIKFQPMLRVLGGTEL